MFALLTWRQCGIYADLETLWRDTLAKNPDAWIAHNNLGIVLLDEGRIPEAVEHCEALRIKPDSAEAHYNLAPPWRKQGRMQEAIGHYEQALRLKPDYPEAHNNLGLALVQAGRLRGGDRALGASAAVQARLRRRALQLGGRLGKAGTHAGGHPAFPAGPANPARFRPKPKMPWRERGPFSKPAQHQRRETRRRFADGATARLRDLKPQGSQIVQSGEPF